MKKKKKTDKKWTKFESIEKKEFVKARQNKFNTNSWIETNYSMSFKVIIIKPIFIRG